MKRKPLKIWQGILIAIGSVFLAVGGVVLYVYLTSGIGSKTIYPEDVSFITDDAKNYNVDRGQFETSDNFFLCLNSATQNVSEKSLKLSFTKNFTDEVDEKGFITDGVITIPQVVEMGTPFEVIVNKENDEGKMINVGGVSNLYAMTENKIVLPTSTKIAIDVPVEDISLDFVDAHNLERKYEYKNNRYNLTEGTEVKINTIFTPERSAYIYSNQEQKKDVFYEITEGLDDFVLNTETGIISVSNNLKRTGKIKAYTFINAEDQIKFYEDNKQKIDQQLYVDAIQYLSGHPSMAKSAEANLIIVEAIVSSFSVAKLDGFDDLKIDSNYIFTAGESEPYSKNLGINIFDSLNQSLPTMIKSVAGRILQKNGNNFEPVGTTTIYKNGQEVTVPKVSIAGGDKVKLSKATDDREFVFINSDVIGSNFKDSNFIVSANVEGEFYLELVLMLRYIDDSDNMSEEETYYVFNDEQESIKLKLNFEQISEGGVDWLNNEAIEMVIYPGEDKPKSQYEKKLNQLTNIPKENVYKKIEFFAEFDDDLAIEEIREYVDVERVDDYEIGGLVHKLALLSSDELLVSKGGSFKLYFATIQTYSNGSAKVNENGTFIVSKWSNSLDVNAVETVVLSEENITVSFNEEQIYLQGSQRQVVAAAGETEFVLNMSLDKENADRIEKQKKNFTVYAKENGKNIENCVQVLSFERVPNSNNYEMNLKFNSNAVINSDSDRELKIILCYSTTLGTSYFTASITNENLAKDTITVYKSEASKIDLGILKNYNDLNIDGYKIVANLSREDNIELKAFRKLDQLIQEIDNGIDDVSSFNSALDQVRVFDKYNFEKDSDFIVSTSNSSIISISNNRIAIDGISGQEGECVISIIAGKKSETISFSSNPVAISKIDKLNAKKYDEEVDSSNRIIQTDNLNNVSVEKLGFSANEITLSKLIKIYIENQILSDEEYYFTLASVQSLSDKDFLFGNNGDKAGMLEVYDKDGNQIYTDTITSSTEITKLKVAYDFYRDISLTFNVIGKNLGLNLTLTLEIRSNIKVETTNFRALNYGDEKQKPEDDGDNIGTYAQFGIDLTNQTYFKVTREDTGAPAPIAWNGLSFSSSSYTVTAGVLKYNDVYEPRNIEATISLSSEVSSNPYAFNYKLKFRVYPNFDINQLNNKLNFTDVAINPGVTSSYFGIKRYVGTEALPNGLTTYITASDFAVMIDNDSFKFKKVVNFSDIYEEKNFAVGVKVVDENLSEHDVCNFEGNIIQINMLLATGFNLNDLKNNNDWIKITCYDEKDVAFVEYFGPSSWYDVDKLNNDYQLQLINIDRPRLNGSIENKLKLNYVVGDKGIVFDEYLDFALIGGDQLKATFRIPMIVSYVGSKLAYYNNVNDLKDILKDNTQDITVQATSFVAGTDNQVILNNTEDPQKEGIYYDDEFAACELEVVEGKDLATISENLISINDLANEDRYILVKVTLSSRKKIGVNFDYYYKIKIAKNLNTEIKYKGNAEMEYVYIAEDDVFEADLSQNERFNIEDLNGDIVVGKETTNKVTKVEYDGRIYNIGGGINEFEENNKVVYAVPNLVRVEFSKINNELMRLAILDTDAEKVKVTVTKTYDGVVNGDLDYVFGINMSPVVYTVRYTAIDENGVLDEENNTWTIDPKSNDITIKTFQALKSEGYNAGEVNTNNIKTVATFNYQQDGYVYETESDETSNSLIIYKGEVSNENKVATIKYDYKNKKLSVEKEEVAIDVNHIVQITFSTEVYSEGEIVGGQTNVGSLKIIFKKTIEIQKSEGNLTGGQELSVMDNLISSIDYYDGNEYTTMASTETTISISTNASFINCDSEECMANAAKFMVSELKEDQTATFTVVIKDSNNNAYTFVITKRFNASLSSDNEIIYASTYYAGQETDPIQFLNKEELEDGSTLSIDGANNEGKLIKQINGINVTLSLSGYKIVIQTGDVPTQTNISIPVKVNYNFGNYNCSFEFVVSLTISPNVVITTNYPKINNIEIADNDHGKYETIKSGEEISDIITFLTEKNPLADGNRVVISKADDSLPEPGDIIVKVKSVSNIENISIGENLTGNVVFNLSGSTPGWVTLNVECNSVVTEYTFFVVGEDVYTTEERYSINAVNKVETVYADRSDGKIFNKDALVELQIKPSTQISDFLNMTIYMEFEKDSNSKIISFNLKPEYCGGKVYVDANESITGFIYKDAYYLDGEYHVDAKTIFKENPITTQRIHLFYRTVEGRREIEVDRFSGSGNENITFESNIIESKVSNQTYTTTFAINIADETVVESVDYKFTLDLDIAVANAFRTGNSNINGNPIIEIDAYYDDQDQVVRDLIHLANIYKPSSGENLSKSTIGNAISSLTVHDGSDSNANEAWNAFKNANPDIADLAQATLDASNENTKFLIYTDIKENNVVYNYNLVGQGAANNGSYVMLVYTYSKDSVSKTFYIMVKINPVYEVLLDGRSITTEDSSISSNEEDSDHIKLDYDEDNGYVINLTNKDQTDPGIVQIRKKYGNNTSNNAYDWTYTLVAEESAGTYNIDLDKLTYISSSITATSSTNLTVTNYNSEKELVTVSYTDSEKTYTGIISSEDLTGTEGTVNLKENKTAVLINSDCWTTTTSEGLTSYTFNKGTEDSATLIISRNSENSFGTKRYKVIVTNKYGYEADIYFDFLPVNSEEPRIDETSSMTAITEEDTFDVGAVYQKLTLTEKEFSLKVGGENYTLNNDKTILRKGSLQWTKKATNTEEIANNKYVTFEGSEFIVSSSPEGNKVSELQQIYTLNEAGFVAPEAEQGSRILNVSGISVWGFEPLDGQTITEVTNGQIEELGTYASESKMNLSKVLVTSIGFNYNGIKVGEITTGGTLATKAGLLVQDETNSLKSNSMYRAPNATFTMPTLDSWIYSDAASTSTSTDTVSVEMRITLQYGTGDDSEFYTISKIIPVTRKLVVDKSQQAVVADGSEFTISGENISDSYFKIGDSTDVNIIDDTLVVSLPKKVNSNNPKVVITADVYENDSSQEFVAKLPAQTIENTAQRDKTFRLYLSKYLKACDDSRLTDKGYILKAGNKVVFSFSGYDENGTFEERDLSSKNFYVSYNGAEVNNNIVVSAITKDKINLEHAELYNGYNSKDYSGVKVTSIVKSYIITYNNKNYRVEKEYLVTPAVYEADFETDAQSVNYNTKEEVLAGVYKYTIPFENWAEFVTIYDAQGTAQTNVARKSAENAFKDLSVSDLSKFKFVIGHDSETQGSATIAEDGTITTRLGYVPGSNEYIHIYVYVKASGVDGNFSEESATYDYLLGSMMVLVRESE